MRARAAFTLIEILLVIGIIAVLAAFIFAAFAPTRLSAREQVCVSNLRQWGQAISMYQSDWDGILPERGVTTTVERMGLPTMNMEWITWCQRSEMKAISKCPNEHRRDQNRRLKSYESIAIRPPFEADIVAEMARKRGHDLPVLACTQHNQAENIETLPSWESIRLLVLRIDGRVTLTRTTANHIGGEW
jgi:prepilin-type N-terminal cleavage/methylation domain-containing protein